MCFYHFLTTLSQLSVLIHMRSYQSRFRVNQRRIMAIQRWKPKDSDLRILVLNSADSEELKANQVRNSTDQRWGFSSEQRWTTSNLWNRASQLWLSLGLQRGSKNKNFQEKQYEAYVFCITYRRLQLFISPQVEIPEKISAERSCFKDLTFSALIQRAWKTTALISFEFLWITAVQN